MEHIANNRKKLFTENNYRFMTIGELVKVYQGVSIVSLKWEKALVTYSAIGPLEAHEALDFSACLAEAADIADQWTAEKFGDPA